jgi:cytochrome bd ubiquinol oxidase subunit II
MHDALPWHRLQFAGKHAAGRLLRCGFGNLIRGVPLDSNGWFSLPLFTDFSAHGPVGILDWYTVPAGSL